MNEHFDELIGRLNSAINALEATSRMAGKPNEYGREASEYMRIFGKIEGLKLALGYVEDYEKLARGATNENK